MAELAKTLCKKCYKQRCQQNSNPKTTERFILDAVKVHGKEYDYSKCVYINAYTKIEIICSKHGSFWQTPGNHLHNQRGCPKCSLCMSKGEMAVNKFLIDNKIEFTYQHKFTDCINPATGMKLKYDFYIPVTNILIEYDGQQHFRIGAKVRNHILTENEVNNIKIRDDLKTQYALDKGIRLIRISYKEANNIDTILKKEIYGKE